VGFSCKGPKVSQRFVQKIKETYAKEATLIMLKGLFNSLFGT
jgi:hypothetical protein